MNTYWYYDTTTGAVSFVSHVIVTVPGYAHLDISGHPQANTAGVGWIYTPKTNTFSPPPNIGPGNPV